MISTLTFDEIYNEVEKSSNETAFNKFECNALYNVAHKIPNVSYIVEIGVQYGRSTTLLGLVARERNSQSYAFGAKENGIKVIGIDNWKEENSEEALVHITRRIHELNLPVELWPKSSKQAAALWLNEFGGISLLHIDGDHSFDAVFEDCKLWCPKVNINGYACFDDYRDDGVEASDYQVKKAVDKYMEMRGTGVVFEKIGVYGSKLAVFKRIA